MSSFHSLFDKWPLEGWTVRNINEVHLFLQRNSSYINEKNEYGETALHRVLSVPKLALDLRLVMLLLDYGADVNCRYDNEQNTPLLAALRAEKDDAVIRILIEKGADVQAHDRSGRTAMCLALGHNASMDILNLLLENGCHPDDCRSHGSALQCAARLGDGILDFLIEAGADVLRFGSDGESPMCLAFLAGAEISHIQKLMGLGASLDACRKHSSPWFCASERYQMSNTYHESVWGEQIKMQVFEMLRKYPSNCVDEQGYTPLQLILLCWEYPMQAIQWLTDQPGVDFSVKDTENHNLLHLAVENCHCKQSVVKLLIEHGVKMDELNFMRETPLATAIGFRRTGAAKFLLENGSPVNGVDILGRSPLYLAVGCIHGFDFIQRLLFAGARIGEASENVEDALSLAVDKFLYDQTETQQNLEVLRLLMKHYILENPDFDVKRMVWWMTLWNSEPTAALNLEIFANECSGEVQLMKSKNITPNRSVFYFATSGNTPSLCNDEFDQLLSIMADNAFSKYLELLSSKVGKPAMITKLQDLQVYTVKNCSGSNCMNTTKVYLNFDTLCEISEFLSTADLLRMILAYIPDSYFSSRCGNKYMAKLHCMEQLGDFLWNSSQIVWTYSALALQYMRSAMKRAGNEIWRKSKSTLQWIFTKDNES